MNSDQDYAYIGQKMYDLMEKLYPICRSITGNGVRKSLNIIQKIIPIEIIEVPTGTEVFDWTIPKEWNIKDAYIKNSKGEKVVDFNKSNLHVLNYSIPVNKKLSLGQLKEHLISLPDYPDWIPYATSYYNETWGFCLSHRQLEDLKDDTYEVVINSTLEKGSLTYGELYIRGETKDEFLFSTYICHPSMCNDNLSGPVLLTYIAEYLINLSRKTPLKYSYRFIFVPETIGSITWLSKNEDALTNIKAGIVATCVGDSGNFVYKKSRIGNSLIDKIVEKVLIDEKNPFQIIEFYPSGSDERQFCSPGFNLPVGVITRSMYLRFPEYHTSADDLDFVDPKSLSESFKKFLMIQSIFEKNRTYLSLNPKCEPFLRKRNLDEKLGGHKGDETYLLSLFWIMNLSDGTNSLLDIALHSKLSFEILSHAAKLLEDTVLIKQI